MQRKIEVGEVIRRVFRIYVDQAPVLMPAAAVVFVFAGIVSDLLQAGGSGLALLALLVRIVATTLFTGMIVELVADVRDGKRDATAGQLVRAVMPVLGQLILVGFVAGIGIVLGFILIIVPGLVLLTIWSVAAPVVVLERPPGLGALGRSRELVRGNGWQVFGVIVALTILVAVIVFALDAAAVSVSSGVGLAVGVVVGVLTAPISSLAQAVLYFDLRDVSAAGGPAVQTPGGEPTPPPSNPFRDG
jgi:hypothetical protein